LLITLGKPTKGMVEVANHSGTFEVSLTHKNYPKVQIVTIEQLMAHHRPDLPTAILPYIQAAPQARLGADVPIRGGVTPLLIRTAPLYSRTCIPKVRLEPGTSAGWVKMTGG
jgi:hypothetical protein